MTSEGDILTALIALMKTEYEEGYRFYTKEEVEGYVKPCFFVDAFLTKEDPNGANTVLKEVTCVIDFYQVERDQEATVDFVNTLRELLLKTDYRHLILPVGTGDDLRNLSVNDYSFNYVGQSNNIPEITFDLEFHDSYAVKDDTDIMEEMKLNLQLGGN